MKNKPETTLISLEIEGSIARVSLQGLTNTTL